MAKLSYRVLIVAALVLAIPLSAVGIISFVPVAVPLILLALAALAGSSFFTTYVRGEGAKRTELMKRLMLFGGERKAWKRAAKGEKDLHSLDVRDADFSEINLRGANLSDSSLFHSNFNMSNCQEASFKNAFLNESRLYLTDLTQSDLSYASFEQASLQQAKLNGANLDHASFRKANLKGADLREVHHDDVDWNGAIFNSETKLPFSREEALARGMVFAA